MTYEEILETVKNSLKKTAVKDVVGHIAVEFDIHGEGEGAFYVEVNDGKITVQPYEYYDNDAKVIISSDELIKILSGQVKPEESVSSGKTIIEGNPECVKEILKFIKKTKGAKTSVKSTKKESSDKSVQVEKEIVKTTKKPSNPIKKDIKK